MFHYFCTHVFSINDMYKMELTSVYLSVLFKQHLIFLCVTPTSHGSMRNKKIQKDRIYTRGKVYSKVADQTHEHPRISNFRTYFSTVYGFYPSLIEIIDHTIKVSKKVTEQTSEIIQAAKQFENYLKRKTFINNAS